MSSNNRKQQQFSSEGFDLDATPSSSEDVVFELGGGTSKVLDGSDKALSADGEHTSKEQLEHDEPPSPIDEAESLKRRGNEQFQLGDYEGAHDLYTEAIETVPTDSALGEKAGEELLSLQEEYDEAVREKRYARQRKESERRYNAGEASYSSRKTDDRADEDNDDEDVDEKVEPFRAPPHRFASKLAVYHCNRSACLLHLERYEDAIWDADVAILYNPAYTKAYVRRMTAYEKTDKIEEALNDAKTANRIDPTNRGIVEHVKRLEKLNEERMEKLKAETMGKLKDLGNSILGNFGLSLDNFKAEKDPNSGSYNISFSNNP